MTLSNHRLAGHDQRREVRSCGAPATMLPGAPKVQGVFVNHCGAPFVKALRTFGPALLLPSA
jgi:hypothetical protein